MYFEQAHVPGRLGLSGFTDAKDLQVYIAGVSLDHRLCQCALAYSGWRHVELILGGQSWVALSARLQNALWSLGGVPLEPRTASLSAAFNNFAEREELTCRYDELCELYGKRATRMNARVSKFSLVSAKHAVYSVSSRLVSHRLKAPVDEARAAAVRLTAPAL